MNDRRTFLHAPVSVRTNGVHSASANKVTGALFYPIGRGLTTVRLSRVRSVFWLMADGVEIAPGIQYSDDGVTWSTANANLGILSAYNGAATWISSSGQTVISPLSTCPGGFEQRVDSGTGAALAKDRLHARFGAFVRNTGSTTNLRGGLLSMELAFGTQDGTQIASRGRVLAYSGGSAATVFTPGAPASSGSNISKLRLTLELTANTGVQVHAAYQQSDDGISWDSAINLESAPTVVTSDGITYGTSFFTPATAPTNKLIRYGVVAKNQTTSDTEFHTALVSMRIDVRRD